jgi:dihydroceramide fatty acyl 2-hydroxylase
MSEGFQEVSAVHESIGAGSEAADALAASPRLFANPVLDKLSRIHHLVPVAVYLPIIAVMVWLGLGEFSPPIVLAGLFAGYAIWTLVEYWGHRYLFHLNFPGRFGARLHFLIHGVHHVYPNDPLRLVMPVLLSGPIQAVAYCALRLIFGAELVWPIMAGFMAGYVGYDMVHYHLHHGTPRTKLGHMLRRRHMLHHFRDQTKAFGVSTPWWDNVFGTLPQS